MSPPSTDRVTLLRFLAVRTELLTPEALAAATDAWEQNRTGTLGQVLVARGLLSAGELAHLEGLAEDILARKAAPRQTDRATLDDLVHELPRTLAPPGEDKAAEPTTATALRYRVLRSHAKGGLGEVFVALDEELQREVALKEIQALHAGNAESRQRFLLEAEVTGRLEHPGIVPVYGLGTYPDGRPYYAMRFIKGNSLLDALQRFHADESLKTDAGKRALELRQLLGRFQDVCNAIAYAHSKGILHRDLKPDNIMLGNYGETLVVDWGLAKAIGTGEETTPTGSMTLDLSSAGSGLTQAGHVLGTPPYMSPEQASGQNAELGPASDVYSLGATLYHLLTGKAPFAGSNAFAILERVCRGQFPRPREVEATIPVALEAICLKAMAFQSEERYATAKALADDLEHWLADEPVEAYREPLRLRVGRWRRRHPALVTGTAALAFTALVALGVGSLLLSREQGRTLNEQQAKLTEQDQRARAQVKTLLNANPQAVPAILDGLEDYREQVRPGLREARAQPEPVQATEAARRLWRQHRTRAALALLPEDAGQLPFLKKRLLAEDVEPEEMLVLRDRLLPHKRELAKELWAEVERHRKEGGRFRALVALAAFDPHHPRWKTAARDAVGPLLAAEPLHVAVWSKGLAGVRDALMGPLQEVFRDPKHPNKGRTAATVLRDYAADRPEVLADLLMDADLQQFPLLLPKVRAHGERAVALLHKELERKPTPDWQDRPLNAKGAVLAGEWRQEIEKAHGLVGERFVLCQALPLKQFDAVAAALGKAGYRPVRLRPHAAAGGPLVAAVWRRDGRPWKAVHGLTADGVRCQDATQRKAGYQPGDVAGYLDGKEERYAALWVKGAAREESRLYVGVTKLLHRADGWGPMRAAKLQPATFQVLIDDEGAARYSAVWRKGGPAGSIFWDDDEKTHADRGLGDGLPLDVCLYANPAAIDNVRAEVGGWLTGSPWLGLNWRHRNLLWPHPQRRYGGCFATSGTFDHVAVFGLPPTEQLRRCRELATQGYRPVALSASRERQRPGSVVIASLWHRPIIAEEVKERLAKRQANAAATLLRLGRPQRVWPLLHHRPDPRVRSYLIHRLSPLGVKARILVKRLDEEPNVSAKRALLLCLGEFDQEQLPGVERQRLIPKLLHLYRTDADAGLHGAADWLLRRWGQADKLRALDKKLVSRGAGLRQRPVVGAGLRQRPVEPVDRRWHVNGQGQTMVMIPGPVEFLMGTPCSEDGREGGAEGKIEKQHRRRIGRSFAIASREVTVEQFLRFRKEQTYNKTYSPTLRHPMNQVSWYQAAEYCNWLSKQEGIPKEQWCYVPNVKGDYAEGMRMKPNWLRLTGYRLPTEAEWEYACRAGATTSRYYGETEELLGHYG